MTIRRFDVCCNYDSGYDCNCESYEDDDPNGAYVAYSDCAKLEDRVAFLEAALREIRDYSAYNNPDEEIIALRDAAVKESSVCPACQRAKRAQWPPSGLCEKHYDTVMNAQIKVTKMFEYKQTWEPHHIARRALEEK